MNATVCSHANSMADENTEICAGLRRRDPDVLDQLIEKYQHRLLRYLVHLTGSRELAEDVFQETWIRVLERGRQYDGRYEFCTWLFAIGRNLVIDQMRRRQMVSLDSMGDEDNGPGIDVPDREAVSAFEEASHREQQEQIAVGLQLIAAEYREALVLRFQEGMSLDEIAAVTGKPLGTVKSRIYRGLSALEPRLRGVRP